VGPVFEVERVRLLKGKAEVEVVYPLRQVREQRVLLAAVADRQPPVQEAAPQRHQGVNSRLQLNGVDASV
jgi:hypothetical protein